MITQLALLVLLFARPMAAEPTTVVIQPSSADTFARQSNPTKNVDGRKNIWVTSASGANDRSFVQFDLSSVPASASITAAELTLYLKTAPSASRTILAQRIAGNWGASSLTWNNQPGTAGTAVAAQSGSQSKVFLSWNVTADVQAMVDGSVSNHGWRIADAQEDSSTEYGCKFGTMETNDGTQRPKLTVTFTLNGSISGRAWSDDNRNGVQDAGEADWSGIAVTLLDSGGSPLDSTSTDGSGAYGFSDLVAGDYAVAFALPNGRTQFSPQDQGGDDGLDSDVDSSTGRSGLVAIVSGLDITDLDAGLFDVSSSISGSIWNDADGNGALDGGETGIEGVTVDLYRDENGDGALDGGDSHLYTESSSGSGDYFFGSLDAGDYIVDVTDTGGVLSGFVLTGGSDPRAVTGLALDTGYSDGDFGYQQRNASIAGLIWPDRDGNGAQDGEEDGLSGVGLQLYRDVNGDGAFDGGDQPLTNASSDGDGQYGFTQLAAGDYLVDIDEATLPAGGHISAGSDPLVVSGLGAGESRDGVDLGYQGDSTISGLAWLDGNLNGIRDAGESGLSGAAISLLRDDDSLIESMVSASDGSYGFSGLFADSYRIQIDLIGSGHVYSPLDQGGDDALDSDIDPSTGRSALVTLAAGESLTTLDCGQADVGYEVNGRAWSDDNEDGIQDAGESGYPGLTVELWETTRGLVDSTTSGADGSYTLGGADPEMDGEQCTIRFTAPALHQWSPKDQAADDIDSDVDPASGHSDAFTISGGDTVWHLDAGLYDVSASISAHVWNDADADGNEDGGEDGIAGVTVDLYHDVNGDGALDGGDALLATESSDAQGDVAFDPVGAGDYLLDVTDSGGVLTGFWLTDGSDPHAISGLPAGGNDTSGRWGYQQRNAAVSGRIWYDISNDGESDNETGLMDVTVGLYRDDDGDGSIDDGEPLLDTDLTDGDGNYAFGGLVAGDYLIDISDESLPEGAERTAGDDPMEVDNLAAGESRAGHDAGYRGPSGVWGLVWSDDDTDGIRDDSDGWLFDVPIRLYTSDSRFVAETTNWLLGYWFWNVLPGDYYLEFSLAETGYAHTAKDVGGDDEIDSDVDPATNRTDVFSVVAEEWATHHDAGQMPAPSTIGDRVWLDANHNGVQDGDESGMPEIAVSLHEGDGTLVQSTTTNGSGQYAFTVHHPEENGKAYYVKFTAPAGYLFSPADQGDDQSDSDVDPSTGRTASTTLDWGETDSTWDAGLYPEPLPSVESVSMDAASMLPQTEATVLVSVDHGDGLTALDTLTLVVYFDADGGAPSAAEAEGQSPDTQNCAIITWSQGAGAFGLDSGANSSWSLGACSAPTSLPGTFTFRFRPGKVATHTTGPAVWQVWAKLSDDSAESASGYDASAPTMAWYGEISVQTPSVDWGTVAMGSDYGANSLSGISVNYICNGDYSQQIKTESAWNGSGSAISIDEGGDPGNGAFGLKADNADLLGEAVTVATTYASINSGSQTGEDGHTESNYTLWLKMGAGGIPASTYGGTITYMIAP